MQARPSYPTETLFGSIRLQTKLTVGWDIVDDDWSLATGPALEPDPALTASAIIQDALGALIAQANLTRQDALHILLR